MAMSNQENSDKLSQARSNLEQSKKRLEQIKAGVNSSKLAPTAAEININNEQLNRDSSRRPTNQFSGKKILFYYEQLGNTTEVFAGTSTVVVALTTALVSRENILLDVTGNDINYPETYQGVNFIPLPKSENLEKFLSDYDIVVFATYLKIFSECQKPSKQIWILHIHNWQLATNEVNHIDKFDLFICLSDIHRQAIASQGVPMNKISVVPNFTDTEVFTPKPIERKPHSIMFAGAIVDHKGLHILFAALPEIRSNFPDTEVHIYGSASLWKDRTDEYEKELRSQQLSGVYFHGAVPNSQMPQIYPQHGIIAVPSQQESFGMVAVEAQACGCIPVVHNTSGVAATLVEGETGFLYWPNTPEELAKTIIRVFKIIDGDGSIRERAINFVRNNLDKTVVLTRYIDVLKEIISQPFTDDQFNLSQIKETSENNSSDVLDFDTCFKHIREPKKKGWIPPNNSDLMSQKLRNLGIEVDDYEINVDEYRQYFQDARYLEDFPDYYSFNRTEKSLEHYLAAKLLKLNSEDIYIDVASETGTVPKIYTKIFGAKTYQQDLKHPPGLNGDTIGGNAADMPLPNEFATKMALHCSFEHFEDDSDIGFVKEAARVLKRGGAVCILPLYLFDEYSVQSDPVNAISSGGVNFEKDAVIYCAAGFNNRHCRFYDPQHFFDRICRNLNGLKLKIYRIKNAKEVDDSCYIQFAAVLEKPLDDDTFGLDQETAKISSSQYKSGLSHPTKKTVGKPNQFSSMSSKPRIDVVLQATGTHGWNFSRGWVNVLQRQGLLNRVFTPVAEWGALEPTDDDGLYEYLRNPEADIMLLLGFDWHSQPLHHNLKWQEQWYNANIKKVGIFQEHCSAEIVQNTPQWQEQISIAIDNAATCVSAIICNHEPDVSWLLNRGIKTPTVFSPFAIDPQYYNCKIPFAQRKNRAVFRGNATPHFNNKTYYQRSQLMDRLKLNHHIDLYPLVTDLLSKPLEAVQSYVDELNTYKLGLNLPSLSPTLTSRPYEIMGCGTLLLQNHVIGDKSNKLFRDWEHLVYYNPENPDDLIEKIEYLLKNPDLAEEIADRGYQLSQEKHTIECRVKELIEWADSGFRVSEDTPKISEAKGSIRLKSQVLNSTTNLHRQSKNSLLVAVDGVFFQLNNTGIARVWKSLLEEWVKDGFAKNILVLDRAGTAPKISGVRYRLISEYNYDDTDRDRQMLQQVCDEEGVDVFISTYYTTPLSTPSVFMGYDMIPELMAQNLDHPMWHEKHKGIRHASAYITISENTQRDLAGCFPNISVDSITVAHCGIDSNFTPASQEEIIRFTSKYEIRKPYFLVVGERIGWKKYKNKTIFFKSFYSLPNWQDFEIVCTGGQSQLEDEIKAHVKNDSGVHLLKLSDAELKVAYSGAVALVYSSLYEGFGMPVAEAMACGCPVITCPYASLPEVGGNAVLYVSGRDVNELVEAMIKVQQPEVRESLIRLGLEQSKQFSWSKMAEIVKSVLIEMAMVKGYNPIENTVSLPTDNYKVSAIVSTYNSEKFIRGRLENLVNQTLYTQGQLEIIVIDSNSEQNEHSIVKEFQNKYPHIIYERTPNRETIYAAWNRGIKMCHGKYVINANADDRFATNALEIMVNKLDDDRHLSAVYGDWLITKLENDSFDSNSEKFNFSYPEFIPPLLLYYQITTHAALIKKSVFDQIGYYKDEMKVFGDREFMLRFSANGLMAKKFQIL
jgi:Glycosyltransferase